MGKKVDMNTALDMIHDGDGVAVSGFMLMTVPREIYRATENVSSRQVIRAA